MKNSVKQFTDQAVSDSNDFINDMTVAEYLLSELESQDHGIYEYLSENEIEAYETNAEAAEALETQVRDFINENYNYRIN